MERVIFVDPEALKGISTEWMAGPDPTLAEAVSDARERLPEALDLLIYQRVYEGMSIPDMARINGLSRREVNVWLYEAERLLRLYLADFALKRWGVRAVTCRVCTHPQGDAIDRLLDTKTSDESWGAFGRRLEQAIGQRIHPPIS